MPYFSLMDSAATSVSDADDTIWWIMVAMTCTAPLLIIGGPFFGLFVKRNFNLTLMRAFGL